MGRDAPRVTVIIPTYNRAWILERAVSSVLAQTFSDFELIIVDDGSTDATSEVIAGYGEKIISIYQENQGVSAARNAGICAAKGDYIAFLDSDDAWMPEKLSVQVAFMEAHPELMICQTEEIWIRNNRRVNPKVKHRKPSGDIFIPSLSLCLVSPSAVMMHRRLFDRVGLFDGSFPACEDYDLWLRVAVDYPVGLIETPLIYKYGGHADQLSASPALDKYRIRSLVRLLDSGVLSEDRAAAATAVLRKKCQVYAAGCEKRGRTAEAAEIIGIAARFDDSACRQVPERFEN